MHFSEPLLTYMISMVSNSVKPVCSKSYVTDLLNGPQQTRRFISWEQYRKCTFYVLGFPT